MFGIGMPELLVVLFVCLLFFGPSRLPRLGDSLGRAVREFGKAAKELTGPAEDPKTES